MISNVVSLQNWKHLSKFPNKFTHLVTFLELFLYVCVRNDGAVNTSTALTEAAFGGLLAQISNSWKVWAATFLLSALPKLPLPTEHSGKRRNYFVECRKDPFVTHTNTQKRRPSTETRRTQTCVCVCVWWQQRPWDFLTAAGHISWANRCVHASALLIQPRLCLFRLSQSCSVSWPSSKGSPGAAMCTHRFLRSAKQQPFQAQPMT